MGAPLMQTIENVDVIREFPSFNHFIAKKCDYNATRYLITQVYPSYILPKQNISCGFARTADGGWSGEWRVGRGLENVYGNLMPGQDPSREKKVECCEGTQTFLSFCEDAEDSVARFTLCKVLRLTSLITGPRLKKKTNTPGSHLLEKVRIDQRRFPGFYLPESHSVERETGGDGFDPGLRHTYVVKNCTSRCSLGTLDLRRSDMGTYYNAWTGRLRVRIM